MKILITGGAGFIGSNLTYFLIKKNYQVTVIDNLITSQLANLKPIIKNKNLRFIKADLLSINFASLGAFNIVFHLASPASPVQYQMHPLETALVNSHGTYRLLNFIKNSKTVFVYASTSEVYGDPKIHPQPENYWGNVNPIGNRSCYDEGERFGETISMIFYKKYGVDIRIARIFNTYGVNMEKNDGRVIANFINQSLTNKPLTVYGNGQQTRSFCYVSDMVNGLDLLVNKKNLAGQVFNLGNPEELTILDLAKKIKKMTQSPSKLVFKPLPQDDPIKRKPDINKAKKILGFYPQIPLNEGLEKTISYFQKRYY